MVIVVNYIDPAERPKVTSEGHGQQKMLALTSLMANIHSLDLPRLWFLSSKQE